MQLSPASCHFPLLLANILLCFYLMVNDKDSHTQKRTEHNRRGICIKVFKKATNALGHMNVILLHTNHQHVLATHVAILSVTKQEYKYNYNVSKSLGV